MEKWTKKAAKESGSWQDSLITLQSRFHLCEMKLILTYLKNAGFVVCLGFFLSISLDQCAVNSLVPLCFYKACLWWCLYPLCCGAEGNCSRQRQPVQPGCRGRGECLQPLHVFETVPSSASGTWTCTSVWCQSFSEFFAEGNEWSSDTV